MSAEKTTNANDHAAEKATNRAKEQFDESAIEPARAYGALITDYYEKLFSTQFEAVRALADKNLAQSRSWLDVKDTESFQKAMKEQQQTIRDMGERLKEDAQKISTLSEEYLKESQQLAMESMQQGRKQLEENVQQGKEQVKNSMQQGKEQAQDNAQHHNDKQKNTPPSEGNQHKSQHQADKSHKSNSTPNKQGH